MTMEPHVPSEALKEYFDIEVPYLKSHLGL